MKRPILGITIATTTIAYSIGLAINLDVKPAFARCNVFGCSNSSVAECNPFGCPNPPLGEQCTPFGCPPSPQPPVQSSGGGYTDGLKLIEAKDGIEFYYQVLNTANNKYAVKLIIKNTTSEPVEITGSLRVMFKKGSSIQMTGKRRIEPQSEDSYVERVYRDNYPEVSSWIIPYIRKIR